MEIQYKCNYVRLRNAAEALMFNTKTNQDLYPGTDSGEVKGQQVRPKDQTTISNFTILNIQPFTLSSTNPCTPPLPHNQKYNKIDKPTNMLFRTEYTVLTHIGVWVKTKISIPYSRCKFKHYCFTFPCLFCCTIVLSQQHTLIINVRARLLNFRHTNVHKGK